MKPTNEMRRRNWLFTINNPVQAEQELFDYLAGLNHVKYFCFGREKGDGTDGNPAGTEHYQGYIEFGEPKNWATMKAYFSEPNVKPNGHIDPRKGTREQAHDYIFKINGYADKEHTRIGKVYEFNEFVGDGERADLFEIMDDVEDGMTNMQLARKHGRKYIQHRAWADEYRQDFMERRFKKERRLNIEVTYIYGVTEAGKTRHVLDAYGDENIYRVTDYGTKFSAERFDGYKCEDIIVFEEFRSQIKIEKMLNYLDVYAIELPSRFRNKWACYTKVFILSNWKLDEQYKYIQAEHPETWKAFLRRIHKVYDFDVSKSHLQGKEAPAPTGFTAGKILSGLRPLSEAEQEELGF